MLRSSRRALRELVTQPRARGVPVVRDGARRHPKRVGRFVNAEPAKESQLDDLTGPRIDDRKRVECVVERNDVDRRSRGVATAPSSGTTSALRPRLAASRARAASTRTRRIMRAVVEKKCARFCQRRRASPGGAGTLVNEVRRLPAVSPTFPSQHLPGHLRGGRWTSGTSCSSASASPRLHACRRLVRSASCFTSQL